MCKSPDIREEGIPAWRLTRLFGITVGQSAWYFTVYRKDADWLFLLVRYFLLITFLGFLIIFRLGWYCENLFFQDHTTFSTPLQPSQLSTICLAIICSVLYWLLLAVLFFPKYGHLVRCFIFRWHDWRTDGKLFFISLYLIGVYQWENLFPPECTC